MIALLLVMLVVLPDLPSVKPPNLVVEVNVLAKAYELLKLVPLGLTHKLPGPVKLLVVRLGTSFSKINAPALMVVAPL